MTQPTQQPNLDRPKYGFHDYVERLNGRAAMMGFLAVLLIEVFTGADIFTFLGL